MTLNNKIFTLFIALILLLSTNNLVFSQRDTVKQQIVDYSASYFTNSYQIATAPYNWNAKSWRKFAVITTATAGLVFFDKNVYDFAQQNTSKPLNYISKNIAEPWGTSLVYKNYSFITMAGLFSFGLIAKNTKAKRCATDGLQAFLIAGLFTIIPKTMLGRKRPEYFQSDANQYRFDGPFEGRSFFSGHTSVSFAFATVVANYYKNTKYIPVIAYTMASVTGLSRIYDQKHWSSDVFAGAAFGIVVGKFITKQNKNISLSFIPTEFGTTYGLCYKF